MRIVFFGNTKYSLIGAKIIHRELGISLVVTIKSSSVEKFAVEQKIPFLVADKLDETVAQQIKHLNPDFFVVEDYGLILPSQILTIPKLASLNIHHSLLPKYRGPSPAPSAILDGEKKSGVTIIHMSDKVDAGDIYAQEEYVLKSDETTDSLLTELNLLGAELTVLTIKNILNGNAKRAKQNEKEATHTNYMKKSDGFVDLSSPPSEQHLNRMIRAFYPWPSVWTRYSLTSQTSQKTLIKLLPDQKIHVEGKKPMSYKDFINGYANGEKFLRAINLIPN